MKHARSMTVGGVALALATMAAAHALAPQPTPMPAPRPPDPGSLISVNVQGPKVDDSYHVMCEQGGLRFNLGGGLLYLDPDTLQITSVAEAPPIGLTPGPVSADIPDRYRAANCSEDGGRTWGRVLLDFYAPNFGESSITHTGYESLVLGDQSSPEHEEIPADDENDLNAMLQVLQQALGDGPGAEQNIGTPTLPTLPSPLFTIDVTYRAPTGQYVAISVPGVIGVPSVVPVENFYGNASETLLVQLGPSQTTSADGAVASSGYALSIQRVTSPNVTATCNPLDADVSVRVGIANPLDPGYPSNTTGMIQLGYRTIGTSTTGHSPSAFTVKYESSTAKDGPTRNDFFVDLQQTPSCNSPGPLDVVGHFVDRGDAVRNDDDVDLTLTLKEPVMTGWTLTRKTDPTYRMMITSVSALPLGELSVRGANKGKTLDATVASIPEALTVCSHKGNQCNRPWRLDRASEASFYITARDRSDKPSALSVRYAEDDPSDHLDLTLKLSDLAYDSYLGRFSYKELPLGPWVHGDYPKWFFFDTLGQRIGGSYHSKSGNHHMGIEIPGYSTRAWNREVVADKKKLGTTIRIDFWGDLVCSPGFSISMDVGGKIAGYLLGQALCHGFVQ